MAEHTPGPWRLKPDEGGHGYDPQEPGYYIVDERGQYVAQVREESWRPDEALEIGAEETEANARLVAAAPDLAAALEAAAASLENVGAHVPAEQAREALAKVAAE